MVADLQPLILVLETSHPSLVLVYFLVELLDDVLDPVQPDGFVLRIIVLSFLHLQLLDPLNEFLVCLLQSLQLVLKHSVLLAVHGHTLLQLLPHTLCQFGLIQ